MAAKVDKANRKAVLLHGGKANFWKPTKKGEKIQGKLIAIKPSKFGMVLRIVAGAGAISIPINDYLKDADFGPLVGKNLEFEYIETVGRGLRIFDVYEVTDDIPF